MAHTLNKAMELAYENKDYIEGLKNGTNIANKSLKDANGDQIDTTYAKKAADNVFSGKNRFSDTVNFTERVTYSGTSVGAVFYNKTYFYGNASFQNISSSGSANFNTLAVTQSISAGGNVSAKSMVQLYSGSDWLSYLSARSVSFRSSTSDSWGDISYDNNRFSVNKPFQFQSVRIDGTGIRFDEETYMALINGVICVAGDFSLTGVTDLADVNISGLINGYAITFQQKAGTVAFTDDVQTAKTQAVEEAGHIADSKIEAAMQNISTNSLNVAGNATIGGNLTVEGTTTSVDTTTISTSERFIQMMKGNTVSVSGYTGIVWPLYDGTNDFFMGLQGEIEVLGKVIADKNAKGDVIGITPISLIPLTGRSDESLLINGNLLAWDSAGKKAVDSGLNPTAINNAEDLRIQHENTRITNEENRQSSFEQYCKVLPFPMSSEDYAHVKNDGYWVEVYVDINGDVAQRVVQARSPDYLFAFQYNANSLYQLTDDPQMAEMLEACAEAKELLENQLFVTAEQYAELERQGLLDDKQVFIDDTDLYNTLVEAGVQEPIRQANETERQAALREVLRMNPKVITTAEYDHIHDDGWYCNWTYANNTWTMAVAAAASGTYSFPYQADVEYPISDQYDLSSVEADIQALYTAVDSKQDEITGLTDNLTSLEYQYPLTAQKLWQTEPNANYAFSYQANAYGTITDSFSTGEVINGVIHLIGNCTLTVSSSASVDEFCKALVTLPQTQANKVYDFNGNTAATAPATPALITAVPCLARFGASYIDCVCEVMNTTVANEISVAVKPKTAQLLSANDEIDAMFRLQLTII